MSLGMNSELTTMPDIRLTWGYVGSLFETHIKGALIIWRMSINIIKKNNFIFPLDIHFD